MEKEEEQRCDCGKLMFKRTSHGFEFMCNRCKRVHLIPFDWFSVEYRNLCPIIKDENREIRIKKSS